MLSYRCILKKHCCNSSTRSRFLQKYVVRHVQSSNIGVRSQSSYYPQRILLACAFFSASIIKMRLSFGFSEDKKPVLNSGKLNGDPDTDNWAILNVPAPIKSHQAIPKAF